MDYLIYYLMKLFEFMVLVLILFEKGFIDLLFGMFGFVFVFVVLIVFLIMGSIFIVNIIFVFIFKSVL